MTGKVDKGQVKGIIKMKADLVESALVRTCHQVKTFHFRTGQVRIHDIRSPLIKSSQDRSGKDLLG